MSEADKELQALVEAVAASAKYRQVSPDLIRAIGQRELAKRSSWKAAVKATKNKLHQVGGAYQVTAIDYGQALAMLRETADMPGPFRAACREIMGQHASTRERLPILDSFYSEIFEHIGPVNSIVDIACGLNPLAWPWMPCDKQVSYVAYDIYADAMAFVQAFMALAGMNGRAAVRDVLSDPPTAPADLALILKSLPCLEKLDKKAATTLLDAVQARYLVISYPVASLGGRGKGMISSYEDHFRRLADGRPWSVQRLALATELVFVVESGRS